MFAARTDHASVYHNAYHHSPCNRRVLVSEASAGRANFGSRIWVNHPGPCCKRRKVCKDNADLCGACSSHNWVWILRRAKQTQFFTVIHASVRVCVLTIGRLSTTFEITCWSPVASTSRQKCYFDVHASRQRRDVGATFSRFQTWCLICLIAGPHPFGDATLMSYCP